MNEAKLPPSLFKYFSPSNIRKTIEGNYLKWGLPCELNDPFEATPGGYAPEDFLPYCRLNHIDGINQSDLAVLDMMRDWQKFKQDVSTIIAFISFSQVSDSMLMWSHYGKDHKGACIEFDTGVLEDKIDSLKPVKYAPEKDAERAKAPLPTSPLGDNDPKYQNKVRAFLSYKAKEWDYEREWRLMVPPMAPCIRSEKSDDDTILVSKIPDNSVKRLIFGFNMPVSERLCLAHTIRKEHKRCQFAEVRLNPSRFKLDIVPLNLDPELATDSAKARPEILTPVCSSAGIMPKRKGE